MRRTCFLIAPLGDRNSATRTRTDALLHDVLMPALGPLGFDVFHADHLGMPGSIRRQVMELVATVDLVVADLTDANPNVLYELAVRHSIAKPVLQMTRDLKTIPFDVAGQRTIPIPDTPAGIPTAIREVRQQTERLLAAPSLFLNPVSELYETVFTPRDATVLSGASVLYQPPTDGRADHPSDHVGKSLWKFDTPDSFQESMLRVADSPVVADLAQLMLQQIQHDPHAGHRLTVLGEPVYVLQCRVPGDKHFPPLHLVYVLESRNHVIVPLGFFSGSGQDGSSSDGSVPPTHGSDGSNSGAVAREAARLLRSAPRRASWH